MVGRAKKKRNKKVPNPINLREQHEKKWVNRICCCICRKLFARKLWAKHVSQRCLSLSLTRAEARAEARVTRKHYSIANSKTETHSAMGPARKTACGRCGKSLTALAMEIHAGSCHKARTTSSADGFPFVLLPKGISDDFRTQIKRYLLNEKASCQRSANRDWDWDWSRLDELEPLRPNMTHVGREGWFGYCVFEFPGTPKVILETPLRGNATYVVGANWRDLISLTKPEIRQGDHQRIFHLGHYWRRRVEQALWKQ